MKNIYKYILIITIMMFGFVGDVEARNDTGINSCVDKETCKLACYYYTTDNKTRFNIYVKDSDYYASVGDGVLKNYYLSYADQTSSFYLSDAAVGLLDKGSCPTNVYYTTSNTDKVCLSNSNEDFCTKKVSSLTKQNVTIGTRRFTVEKKANECVNNNSCKLMCQYFGMAKTINIYKSNNILKVSLNDGNLKDIQFYTNIPGSVSDKPLIPSYMNEGKNKLCPTTAYLDNYNRICFDSNDYKCTYTASLNNSYKIVNTTLAPENFIETSDTSDNKNEIVYNSNNVADCAKGDNPTCEVLCPYEKGNKFAYIYKSSDNKLAVSYSWNNSLLSNNSKLLYYFDTSTNKVFIQPEARTELEINRICPKNFYDDIELEKEICFDNDGKWCLNQDNGDKFSETEKNESEETIIVPEEKMEGLITSEISQDLSCKTAYESIKNLDSNISDSNFKQVCAYNKGNVSGNADQFFIAVIDNRYRYFWYTIGENGEKWTEIKNVEGLKYKYDCTSQQELFKIIDVDEFGSKSVTFKSKRSLGDFLKLNYKYPYQCEYRSSDTSDWGEYNPESCVTLIGTDLVEEIQSYLLYIKIAVPILIIVLGSIDFGKAFIASDEDAMKKAQKHFIMRIIIGMVIFFIPSILNALLNLANQVWGIFGDTCGITF